MPDGNVVAPVGGEIGNLLNTAGSFVMAQVNSAMALVSQNVMFIVVIGILTWLVSEYALSKVMDKSWIRHFASFLVVMMLSGVWVGIVSAWL